jgi:hypothetical protein
MAFLFGKGNKSSKATTRIVKHTGAQPVRAEIRWDAHMGTQDRRWETRVESFEGFNSPPGRF